MESFGEVVNLVKEYVRERVSDVAYNCCVSFKFDGLNKGDPAVVCHIGDALPDIFFYEVYHFAK